jgi:hypothetical protein
MAYIKIINKSGQKIDLSNAANKLKPYFNLVDKSKYPFIVTIIKKKDFYDRSNFDMNSGKLTLKADLNQQSMEDIEFVFVHEFTHFLTKNNPELSKIAFSKENEFLQKILKKQFKVSDEQMDEVFHDMLSYEIVANFLATLIIGKFHKRHPISNIAKFINGKRNEQRGHNKM